MSGIFLRLEAFPNKDTVLVYKNFVIILAVVSLAALLLTQAAIHQSPEFLEGRFLTLLAIDVALIAIFAVLVVIMMTRLIMAWRAAFWGYGYPCA